MLLIAGVLLINPITIALADSQKDQPEPEQSTSVTVADTWVYLPLLNTPSESNSIPGARRVNAPFVDPTLSDDPKRDSTIFWFGKVTPDDNYTDVRVRYENNRVVFDIEVFDRLLWYDKTSVPNPATFSSWDSVTLLFKMDASPASAPTRNSYRIDAMVNHWEPRLNYQKFYRGNGSTWEGIDLGLTTTSGWNGDTFNNTTEDRGWLMRISLPYNNLGLSVKPPAGTLWQAGLIVYDRDDATGSPIAPSRWPENTQLEDPRTWGELHFGIPKYQPPAGPTTGTAIIRQGLENAIVPDAAVGGTVDNLCPGDPYFIWNLWGNMNFGDAESLNIQNQANVADWPCFAKYFVTFPLDQIPPGKTILSASLILHHWGNNGPTDQAEYSVVHVFSIGEEWDESTLTWNNAPLGFENLDQIVVPLVDCTDGTTRYLWPCMPRVWDVSRAVDQAYRSQQPARLALYSSDTALHSGKLFTTSETGDWNETGRPTLMITYGDN